MNGNKDLNGGVLILWSIDFFTLSILGIFHIHEQVQLGPEVVLSSLTWSYPA
jgi:hypothetical protein